jgi:D-sedoheptulose 7-phosphate isomerase
LGSYTSDLLKNRCIYLTASNRKELKMSLFFEYSQRLNKVLSDFNWDSVNQLALDVKKVWLGKKQIFFCGNGGSAANSIHLANDFNYGVSKKFGKGIRVNALPSNQAITTCLANDLSYEHIFSHQLAVSGNRGDLLIVLSGSGNSPNIVNALHVAKEKGIKTCAVLGYSGGVCLNIADYSLHFIIDDMQISEDCQLIVGHMVMRWLYENVQEVPD